MTDQPGFAALETTILEALAGSIDCDIGPIDQLVYQRAARVVCEAITTPGNGIYWWTTDSRLIAEPEEGAWPVLVTRLAGRGETHTT